MAVHKTTTINGIDIDKSIAPLITELWLRGVRTYESCGGGKLNIAELGFKDVTDFVAQGNSVSNPESDFFLYQGEVYEKAFIVSHVDDLPTLLELLSGRDINVELNSTGGYMLNEYVDNPPEDHECVFIRFKNV